MEKASDKSRFGSGDLIAGRYRVENEVGRGRMGIVPRAIDVQLGRPVALKMLRPEFEDDAGLRRRLATEARTASGLAHPGIATVFDLVESTEASFIVYEFVDGRTLRTRFACCSLNMPSRCSVVRCRTALRSIASINSPIDLAETRKLNPAG